MAEKKYTVRPDSKGRICLGRVAESVSSYTVIHDHGRIILEPNIEIPAKEAWLWRNESALSDVKQGLKDSAAGRVVSGGDFTKYLDEDDDFQDSTHKKSQR